ncbi:YqhA family protein [Lewinella cohaerens]|uniref:YqhA family protein n=1 Tax=Lewinella cohaerens TaxID=70995 RepID=UPI00038114FF|nr:YqhA family protein [Lewinella cohaerens]
MPSSKSPIVIGYLMKIIALVAVIAIMLLAIGVEYFAITQIAKNLTAIITGTSKEDIVVKDVLKSLDIVLLGVIFFTMAASLFELFIQKIDSLPDWLSITNLDQLKAMMIKMIIVVMAISFTGKIITWNGETEIAYYGVGLAAVIGALSYFLLVKQEEK